MLAWVYGMAEKIEEEARRDAEYCALARRQAELAPQYEEILARMDPQERETLLDHILVREEMLYRMAQLAWKYGTQHP